MPDFKEQADIIIQPGDFKVAYTFSLPAASSNTANDGAIPYGTEISSIAVTALKSDGTAATGLIFSSAKSAEAITVKFSYPSTGVGVYHVEFLVTLNNGDSTVIEFDFNRVKVRDK